MVVLPKPNEIVHNWVLEYYWGDSLYRSKADIDKVHRAIRLHGMRSYIKNGISEAWLDSVLRIRVN
jgi:hypothetical protein